MIDEHPDKLGVSEEVATRLTNDIVRFVETDGVLDQMEARGPFRMRLKSSDWEIDVEIDARRSRPA